MIPVLYKLSFDTPFTRIIGYLLALALVAYAAWSGYRGARGPLNAKTGEYAAPGRNEQLQRTLLYGVIGVVLAGVGLYYAMPEVPLLGKGKGEGIPIHTYGILVGSGFICAVTVGGWLAQREWLGEEGDRKREQLFDLAFYVFIGAMVGSRVLFILVNWKDYASDPKKIFDLGGGLVFYGGLIGATITSYFYAKKNKIEFLRLADLAMPAVSLGQCLGRLGCFSAGCCWGDIAKPGTRFAVMFPGQAVKNLFGGPSGTPSLAYSSQVSDSRYVLESSAQIFHQAVPGAVKISEWAARHGHTFPVHPTQLYESVGQLCLFLALLTMRRYRRFHGQIFGMWLMCYAILRSTVELFRGDVERGTLNGLLNYLGAPSLASRVPLEAWYNLSVSQFISICLFSLGATVLYRKSREVMAQSALEVGNLAPV